MKLDSTCTSALPVVTMPTCSTPPVLAGQVALVTGANSGIGKGVALALAQAGADVVVNFRDGREAAEAVVASSAAAGRRGVAIQAGGGMARPAPGVPPLGPRAGGGAAQQPGGGR